MKKITEEEQQLIESLKTFSQKNMEDSAFKELSERDNTFISELLHKLYESVEDVIDIEEEKRRIQDVCLVVDYKIKQLIYCAQLTKHDENSEETTHHELYLNEAIELTVITLKLLPFDRAFQQIEILLGNFSPDQNIAKTRSSNDYALADEFQNIYERIFSVFADSDTSLLGKICNSYNPKSFIQFMIKHQLDFTSKEEINIIWAAIVISEISKKLGVTFNPLFLRSSEIEPNSEKLHTYFNSLSLSARNGQSYNRTIILVDEDCGSYGHWLCAHLHCSMQNGHPVLLLNYFEPTKNHYSVRMKSALAQIILSAFGANIRIFRTGKGVQRNGEDCKMFALLFARQLHSIMYGKFAKKYPDEKTFLVDISLATKRSYNNSTCYALDGMNYDDNIMEAMPAKFLTASQFYKKPTMDNGSEHNDKSAENAAEFSRDELLRIAKSDGLTVQQCLQSYTKFRDNHTFNNKVHKKYMKYRKLYHNYLATNDITVEGIQNILDRYTISSLDSFPAVSASEIITAGYNAKRPRIVN